ncbi:unnamed protein product [Penicillium pancosmium]
MATTEKLKSRFPDLNFVKPLPVDKHPRYEKFGIKFSPNKRTVLPKGHVKEDGRKKVLADTLLNSDTPIKLRDGVHVYADIFRPATSDEHPVPAVICWSPYGKTSISLDMIWHRAGVPKDWTSGYETFEGLDPAEWTRRGYAIINVDARGAQFSEGTFFFWGDQEAEDIYDTIDYLSKQPWCNGSVCMGGNSYLAKAQVSFASRQSHPAMKALAPWEGFTDIYRQLYLRGGFSMNNVFAAQYQWGVASGKGVEDVAQMVKTHPLFDDYWAQKYDEVSNIDVPLYVLGSFGNPFHVYGSFDTFRRAKSTHKWMRVHARFEWYEMYEPKSIDDLQRFYDRYAKGIMNGWETDTSPLRLSLHGFGTVPNIVERSEIEFPLKRQQLRKYYLDASVKSLKSLLPPDEAVASYDSVDLNASSDFTFHFDEYTEIAGYAKVRLWMSCEERDDMDVVVQLRKIDNSGKPIKEIHFPCPAPENEAPEGETVKLYGPQGFLRASSMMSRDPSRSSADGQEVFYRHDQEVKVPRGSIVPLEITLWPMGMVFAPGEGIKLSVAGHFLSAPATPAIQLEKLDNENLGQHLLHTGGKHDSCLTLPVIAGNRT